MHCEPKVNIVDDDQQFRKSMAWLLSKAGYSVEEYGSGDTFLEAGAIAAGCILLDIRMPGMSGLELQLRLFEARNLMPVIIVTGHADVPLAVRCMKNGAFGVFEKPFNSRDLLNCVSDAMTFDATRRRREAYNAEVRARLARLTSREDEVARLVADGMSSKQIGYSLHISIRTVEVHRGRIMKKLGVGSVAELTSLLERTRTSEPSVWDHRIPFARLVSQPEPRSAEAPIVPTTRIDTLQRGVLP